MSVRLIDCLCVCQCRLCELWMHGVSALVCASFVRVIVCDGVLRVRIV